MFTRCRPGFPHRRPLRPVTASIYSQLPDPGEDDDDTYGEDSFVVDGDEVEFQSQQDTLDLLEAGIERKRGKAPASVPSPKMKRRKMVDRKALMSSSEEEK